jgi:hypothetical protein
MGNVKYGNEISRPLKCGEFLEWLRNFEALVSYR